jgi:Gluconate 2-dehydrogenase subunit 3
MPQIARRGFVQGVGLGALAFTVGGAELMLTPAEARAQRVPFHILKADEVAALDALGETLAIGAREAGISHFVDQQLSVEPAYALLSIRVTETRPPYLNFYRAALNGVDRASQAQHKMIFAELGAQQQYDFVDRMRQNTLDNWQGPSQTGVYLTLRNDAIDVAYGTVEGFARLGVPYMPHIVPTKRW